MLVEKNITLYSCCEHHFVPIIGKAHVAYISLGRVIGLSKLNRIVKYYARRPQVEERLTMQIACELKTILDTEDVAVIIDAVHLCVSSGGIEDTASSTITAEYSGKFLENSAKSELLKLIQQTRKMEEHIVKILSTEYVTQNVKRFRLEKPEGYSFIPGQATEVAINKPEWRNERRPFTFTSLNEWPELEFTIKIYRDHHRVTEQLEKLQAGDELIIHDVWGVISYKGPGVFIAGGAGITPFIAILRQLKKDNMLAGNSLIFSNMTSADIILWDELEEMLGRDLHNVLTREHVIGFHDQRIGEDYLIETIRNFSQHFYVCGPEGFVKDIEAILVKLGAKADAVVFEK